MPVTPSNLFLALFWIMWAGFLWIPVTWLLLSIFTPSRLLDRYFKEPHFTLTETYMMREFPGFLMRTAMFGWALVLPSMDRKRNIKNVRDYMPGWYAVALKSFIWGVILTGIGMFGLMAVLFLLPAEYGPEQVLFSIPWPF